jgi:hypothetical protein
MRFLPFILTASALLSPTMTRAESLARHHVAAKHRLTGKLLGQRMVQALSRETRIQVQGTLAARGSKAAQYLLRYQASGRESLTVTGGTFARVQVGNHSLTGVRTISIGRTTFRSFDGSHWVRLSGTPTPSPLDALSLNGGDVPCCAAYDKRVRVHLVNNGLTSRHGTRVYVLAFRRGAGNQFLTGTVILNAGTYLPLSYTETLQPSASQGTFTLTYGGTFEIRTPR